MTYYSDLMAEFIATTPDEIDECAEGWEEVSFMHERKQDHMRRILGGEQYEKRVAVFRQNRGRAAAHTRWKQKQGVT